MPANLSARQSGTLTTLLAALTIVRTNNNTNTTTACTHVVLTLSAYHADAGLAEKLDTTNTKKVDVGDDDYVASRHSWLCPRTHTTIKQQILTARMVAPMSHMQPFDTSPSVSSVLSCHGTIHCSWLRGRVRHTQTCPASLLL